MVTPCQPGSRKPKVGLKNDPAVKFTDPIRKRSGCPLRQDGALMFSKKKSVP